ncbi:MAG: hypothetical protein QXT87_00490 [Thermoproteota archaeon]
MELSQLFEKLGVSDSELLAKEIKHFTEEEAEKRDRILLNYFGEEGVNRIVNKITELFLHGQNCLLEANVLDVGAGTGLFTLKVAEKLQRPVFMPWI